MGEIKTDVDRIVALVKEKKEISLDLAAKTLSIDRNTLTSLAESLEDNGVISIQYRFARAVLVDTGALEEKKKDKNKKQFLPRNRASALPKEKAVPKKPSTPKETLKANVRKGIIEIEAEEASTRKIKSDFDRIFREQTNILSRIDTLSKHESAIKSEMAGLSRTADFMSMLPRFKEKKQMKDLEKRFKKFKNEKNAIHLEIQNLKKLLSI